MSFLNKVVLVTGASSGIGAATAQLFAKEGAKVALVGRNVKKLNKVAEKCQSNAIHVIRADISHDDEAKTVMDTTISKFEKLDVLVNNAGISQYATIFDENLMKCYDEIMKINVRAHVYMTHLAVPHLIESKAGMDHFTRAAAKELAPHGVRVNSVSPGPVRTDIMENSGYIDVSWDEAKHLTMLHKISEPEEIADLITFLASEKARSITGSNYICDNGAKLKHN
ncbi:3-oxoacyl-[acyl-carrier-protein] reductase FabG-like isoform X1 [Leptidea sinapis]|uniref:3-oxoacyl-[acyl-carrier-protein] reductase FabG-like isoform X1 n=1 Tax=Leptidea sinapis TaxID=189913 RepID=UPI00212C955A|nr:3-oxoacyl-[acyl-carrier-protein] reductase FabG-like isoform X1 [Leptidea sinapis]